MCLIAQPDSLARVTLANDTGKAPALRVGSSSHRTHMDWTGSSSLLLIAPEHPLPPPAGMAHHAGPNPPCGTFRLFSPLLQPALPHRKRPPCAHVERPPRASWKPASPSWRFHIELHFNRPQGFPCTLKLEQHRSRELCIKGVSCLARHPQITAETARMAPKDPLTSGL